MRWPTGRSRWERWMVHANEHEFVLQQKTFEAGERRGLRARDHERIIAHRISIASSW